MPLLAGFLLLFLFSAKAIVNSDLGFHLKGGQWTVQNHSVPKVDSYTYTSAGNTYIDSHWFYQLILYGVYKVGSYPTLTLMNMAVLAGVFVLLLLRLRLTQAPPWAESILLVTAVFCVERRIIIRPEIFSWFLLCATLVVLDLWYMEKKNLLWVLVALQLLWVNIEGLFILGWIVMACYWASSCLKRKRLDKKLLQFSLLALAADLVNPNFLAGVAYPFSFISKLQGDIYHETITELFSIPKFLSKQNLHFDSNLNLFIFFAFSALVFALLLATLRSRKLHEILILGVFFYLAMTAVRNVPLFMLTALPIAAVSLRDLRPRLEKWAGKGNFHLWLRRGLPLLLTFLYLLFAPRIVTDAYYLSDRRPDRFGLGLDMDQMPVEAAAFLAQNHLDGKIINMSNFGGWFDWAAPQPTFIDGRWEIQNGDIYKQYLDMAFQNGLAGWAQTYNAQLIVFEPRYPPSWVVQLAQMSEWRPIYLDGCAAVYARNDYAPQMKALTEGDVLNAFGLKPPGGDMDLVSSLGLLHPSPMGSWLEGFYKKQRYPLGLLNGGVFASGSNQPMLSSAFYVEMLRQSGGLYEEIWFDLAQESLKLRNFSTAMMCYQKILQIDPGNSLAKQMAARVF
jgi:hypothetical protein